VILLLASEFDDIARQAASTWPGGDAIFMTPSDLCEPGWRVGDCADTSYVAEKLTISPTKVTGIITLLTQIQEQELVDIVPEDRRYVARELNAFLLFLLTSTTCNVLNRPVDGGLCGPCWEPEKWAAICHSMGMPHAPVRRGSGCAPEQAGGDQDSPVVEVLGGRVLGNPSPVDAQAIALAKAAQTSYGRFMFQRFDDIWRFNAADCRPDLADPRTCQALATHLS